MDQIDFSSPIFEKLVHLDLKGAPPLLSYLKQVFPLLKQMGATGLLIEYEDMFPYQGDLQIVSQPDSYSKEEIKRIQKMALENNLTVIPLVQTFGHLEFLLKHQKYCNLREVMRYVNFLCPSHPAAEAVILQMINQIIDAHQDLKYLHLGADEVWIIGDCSLCREKMKEQGWTKEQLFLNYISCLIKKLQNKYSDIKYIIWDDMMRSIDIDIIKKSGIGNLVQPMVWHYLPLEDFQLKPPLWEKYAAVFPDIWVASAFKGATEMTKIVAPPRFHINNHLAWIQILQQEGHNFSKVHGLAVTGWQRFDHYTVLCELLPVALPTLAVCLQTLIDGDLTEEGQKKASQLLGFSDKIELDPFLSPQTLPISNNFPGGNVYNSCLQLCSIITEYHALMHHPSIEGAFSSYHVMHNRISNLHVDQFLSRARTLMINMEALYVQFQDQMGQIYYPSTVEEWLSVNISPLLVKMRKLVRDADQQVVFNMSILDS